ncbi:tRNA (N6-threonylcarbamoyladenosine(37)-N6)-methyltransferase TrmO [Bacteriovorax stolpii]|uniref:tRNA (N6-threonylcarbamoyladenosine(37)-N6)-methyltransferase TrmO n=1 Tax=Bacteriovorax stolpii TaxID=960 RepID=UPI001159BC02|nr:tRNA (N6-threonylcarbamoyladenosine(37)-N6)-methyltransferase TrmO [Bacteriovorax stolpii]QDK40664.1 tRNA (N6-threonylcarbamoyladenosine(37)-N6)-methyltransferase TrmO [Bacteriovorax stolpii]
MKKIARIHSPYKEKFSIPRQPGLTSIESTIELLPPFNRTEALMGLEAFSHLWVIFEFHEVKPTDESSLTVRPPRLGGNTKQGVFATRSPFRPNNVGLSLVKIERIEGTKIVVSGGDFLDQTPVYDLKPYLKEIESKPEAVSGWTDEMEVKRLSVVFKCECDFELKDKIVDILSLDPRPRFHEDGYKTYGSRLFNVDVHWEVLDNTVFVTKILT